MASDAVKAAITHDPILVDLALQGGGSHEQYVWRFLRTEKIDLSGRKSWCESDDPEFVAKAADVVGLYMNVA